MDYALYSMAELPSASPAWLDDAERAVAATRGASYTTVRCLLKSELARRSCCRPQDVHLHYGEHGKPLWEHAEFNLSHSKGLLALAFHDRAVGIDIEAHRPCRRETLAERIMAEPQLAAFCARGCPEQEFFDCWCATEALVKWAGNTIFAAQHYPYCYDAGRIIPLFTGAPRVELFCPAEGMSGAVAYCP